MVFFFINVGFRELFSWHSEPSIEEMNVEENYENKDDEEEPFLEEENS